MSDELVAKMKAAASSAIAEADAAAEAEAPEAEAQATSEEGATQDAPAVEADEEPAEAEPETGDPDAETGESEEEAGEPDYAEQVLAIRKQAESRIRKAENYARELEQKLQYAAKYIEQSKKEVAEDIFKKLRRAPARTFKEFGLTSRNSSMPACERGPTTTRMASLTRCGGRLLSFAVSARKRQPNALP